jgi:Fe2+ or Zn2+ uptake regulation protein
MNLFSIFFNTTSESGATVKQFTVKAESQNKRVVRILTEAGTHLSPSEVWARYCKYYNAKTPITSIRRALSDLTKNGVIEMVYVKKIGLFGRPTYQWRVKNV